jgi:hypothetical protein
MVFDNNLKCFSSASNRLLIPFCSLSQLINIKKWSFTPLCESRKPLFYLAAALSICIPTCPPELYTVPCPCLQSYTIYILYFVVIAQKFQRFRVKKNTYNLFDLSFSNFSAVFLSRFFEGVA